jgi:hypothetical protein
MNKNKFTQQAIQWLKCNAVKITPERIDSLAKDLYKIAMQERSNSKRINKLEHISRISEPKFDW